LALRTELDSIPSPTPYLSSSNQKCEEWLQRLGEKDRPRVGLVWSGSVEHKNDHHRSLTLSELLPYLPNSYEYLSLQKELRDIDKFALEQSRVKYYGENLKDFTDTAALCELVDLVISVDTSVSHLAGAIGKKTWVLLPYSPDFRWLHGRENSPWYESMKLYRQGENKTWLPVLERVGRDLGELLD
jgi:ADP-heptose:LPS heptosyltransferase